jgi:flagellar protein FliS
MFGSGYQAYQKSHVLTADPKRLVILCYEEAIKGLVQAKERYLSMDYEAKGRAVQKTIDLLNHLREVLDFEKGGEIAKQLDRLYGFMISHIMKSDLRKDVTGFAQVAEMLEQLKSAWEEAMYRQPDDPSTASKRASLFISGP